MLLGTHVVAAVDPDKQNATCGEVVEMLMYAADNYNPDLKRTDIIHGYGGDDNLQEDREVSRVEALIMLARAFGSFPALKGHNERVAFQNGEFSDIPDWAKPEIAPVLASGIAMGTGDGIFSSYSPVTKGQMKLFIKRTFALFGSNEKDDFYAAVNRDKLNSLVILPAHTSAGTLTDLELEASTYEENLGAIGYVIAHEITHAFDNNGAKFDEDGNAYDWWTEKDYAEFEKRCEKMVQFYNGCEGIPGIPMNGRLTLSENVADQGAVQCITEIASRLPNPDYQKLYRSMANAWASTKTREYAQYAAIVDVHAEDKLRVNRVVVNCEEFYEAFGITENDGMWVAPEDRVIIW